MATYLSIDLNPRDESAIAAYEAAMPPVLERYGARVIARDESPMIPEGDRTARIAVIIEFEDKDAFRRFYESAEYAPLKAHRRAHAETHAVVLDGTGK